MQPVQAVPREDNDVSWIDEMQVEERRLQEYLHQKEHVLLLKGAAEVLGHTLVTIPTTCADDGPVRFGDSLMIRSNCTEGLLQADIADKVAVANTTLTGASLSTGKMFTPCPRNVFTISRVSYDDGFADDPNVHYGQSLRLGTQPSLHDRPLYLQANASADGGEPLLCLHPRANAGTHWRLLPPTPGGRAAAVTASSVVQLCTTLRIENVNVGYNVHSDRKLRMNSYGNEYRIYGAAHDGSSASSAEWSFVNSLWAESLVEAAREAQRTAGGGAASSSIIGASGTGGTNRHETQICGPPGSLALANRMSSATCDFASSASTARVAAGSGDRGGGVSEEHWDHGELLKNPVYRADFELQAMEKGRAAVYKVVVRLYPLLRRAGMHVVRKLRGMCMQADVDDSGTLPARTFEGVLSWVGVRLQGQEIKQLTELFETAPGSGIVDYRRFFTLMAPTMPELRKEVVRDAYSKLAAQAAGGYVGVPHVQRCWNPRCHPGVQSGELLEAEALDDFLRQWDVTSAEGLISFEEFLDYYRDVSIAVEKDELFVELVRCAWNL